MTYLFIAVILAISVGYTGTLIANKFRKDCDELDQQSIQ